MDYGGLCVEKTMSKQQTWTTLTHKESETETRKFYLSFKEASRFRRLTAASKYTVHSDVSFCLAFSSESCSFRVECRNSLFAIPAVPLTGDSSTEEQSERSEFSKIRGGCSLVYDKLQRTLHVSRVQRVGLEHISGRKDHEMNRLDR